MNEYSEECRLSFNAADRDKTEQKMLAIKHAADRRVGRLSLDRIKIRIMEILCVNRKGGILMLSEGMLARRGNRVGRSTKHNF